MENAERPDGVTVVAILNFIGGALSILGGIAFTIFGPLVMTKFIEGFPEKATFFTAILEVLGVFYIVVGIISLVVGYGLLKGAKWAYWLVVIFSAIGVAFAVITLVTGGIPSIIPAVVNGLILYYFLRPNVKYYFGV